MWSSLVKIIGSFVCKMMATSQELVNKAPLKVKQNELIFSYWTCEMYAWLTAILFEDCIKSRCSLTRESSKILCDFLDAFYRVKLTLPLNYFRIRIIMIMKAEKCQGNSIQLYRLWKIEYENRVLDMNFIIRFLISFTHRNQRIYLGSQVQYLMLFVIWCSCLKR